MDIVSCSEFSVVVRSWHEFLRHLTGESALFQRWWISRAKGFSRPSIFNRARRSANSDFTLEVFVVLTSKVFVGRCKGEHLPIRLRYETVLVAVLTTW